MKLTVMTFNLRVNTPIDGINVWPNRSDRVIEAITEADPDIIGTQEGTLDMLKDLDKGLPEYSRFGRGRLDLGQAETDEFCAVYYKKDLFQIVEEGQFWLSETPDNPGSLSWDSSLPRICSWALLASKIQPDQHFYAYNTHYDHLGQQAREESSRLLIEHITSSTSKDVPFLLTGDFNAEPGNLALAMLHESFQSVYSVMNAPPGRTFHGYSGGHDGEPIDFIFASQNIKLLSAYVDTKQRNYGFPSDHYAVIANVKL